LDTSLSCCAFAQLVDCETKVLELCSNLDKSLASRLVGAGVEPDRLSNLMNAASRSCHTNLKNTFQGISAAATDSQRDLNRSLLPMVERHMHAGYREALIVRRGRGCFTRVKRVMANHMEQMTRTMFHECTTELLESIESMVQKLSAMISAVVDIIFKTSEMIYSVMWGARSDKSMIMNPDELKEMRACREGLLPAIHAIVRRMGKAMDIMGIQRRHLHLEDMGIESRDVQNQRKLMAAEQQGMVIDLCDDDNDNDDSDHDDDSEQHDDSEHDNSEHDDSDHDDSEHDEEDPDSTQESTSVAKMADVLNLPCRSSSTGFKVEKDDTAAGKRESIHI